MERTKAIAVAAALVAATFILAPVGTAQPVPTATAPGKAANAAILFLDRATVQRQSAAGKDMYLQFEALMMKMRADFAPENQKLQTDLQALNSPPTTTANPEVRRAKYNELQARRAALEKKIQDRQDALEAGLVQARTQLEKGLKPILEKIMREREANLLLDRGFIIRGGGDLDVTALVIQRLNVALPKIAVVPVTPPAAPPGP